MGLLLGIDLGSSAVKATLVRTGERGGIAATRSAQNSLASPRPGWAEADPAEWWSNVCTIIPALLADAGAGAGDVLAVATTGMVPAVVCVDAAGSPLRPAILQNDARAAAEIDDLRAELSALDLVALTGSALTQQSVAPTLRWLERHEPETFAATAAVVGGYDWLLARLGAERHVEDNWALESGLYLLDGRPCAEVLAAAHWPAGRLVPVHRPGEVAGQMSAEAASATGLRVGTPLVVGGADHVLAAYAAGLQRPGQLLVKLGGAGDILAVAAGPVVDPRLYLDRHPAPGWFMPNGCMATSGTLLRWFQRELAAGAGFDVLDAEAERAGAGAGGLVCLPYLLGEKCPIHDADARGVFLGLHLGHTRGHLFRACLEATALSAFATTWTSWTRSASRYGTRASPTAAPARRCGSRSWPTSASCACGRCSTIPGPRSARPSPPGSGSARSPAGMRCTTWCSWARRSSRPQSRRRGPRTRATTRSTASCGRRSPRWSIALRGRRRHEQRADRGRDRRRFGHRPGDRA